MKPTTWVKTILMIAILIGLYYLVGRELGSIELRLRAQEVADLDESGWGKPVLRLLAAILAAASWTGVTAILIRPLALEVLGGILAVIALIFGWQGELARSLEFLNEPLGLGTFLVLAAATTVYVISVAHDVKNRISFSHTSVASRLTLLFLAFAALIGLVFFSGIHEQVINVRFSSLLERSGLEEILLETADRLIPIKALEDVVAEVVATIADEIARLLDSGLGPYLVYVAPALSALLFLMFVALSIPLSWICPWVAGATMLLMRAFGIVRVGRATTIVRRLSLERCEPPTEPEQPPT
jgi:hypothetical protein